MGAKNAKERNAAVDAVVEQIGASKWSRNRVEKLFDLFFKHATKTGSLDVATFKKLMVSNEMREIMENLSIDSGSQDADFEALFRAFDADGSGTVEFGEFALACYISDSRDVSEKVKFVFKMIDKNRVGSLSREQVKQNTAGTSLRDKADQIFDAVDTTKSGSITEQQFVNVMTSDLNARSLIDPDAAALLTDRETVKRHGGYHRSILFIDNTSQKTLIPENDESETLVAIAEKLQDKTGTPPDWFRYFYNKRQLSLDKTLKEQGVMLPALIRCMPAPKK